MESDQKYIDNKKELDSLSNRLKRKTNKPARYCEPGQIVKKSKVKSSVLDNPMTLPGTIEMPLTEEVKSYTSKKHECPVCFKKFLKKENMHIHLNKHKDNETVMKMKAAWEEKNRAVKKSTQFIQDARDKLRALRCKDCKLKFSSEDLCSEHMKQHANEAKKEPLLEHVSSSRKGKDSDNQTPPEMEIEASKQAEFNESDLSTDQTSKGSEDQTIKTQPLKGKKHVSFVLRS